MSQEKASAAVALDAELVKHLFWFLALFHPLLELFPEASYGPSATQAPWWYQHNITNYI